MKGLLKKDFYVLGRQMRLFLVFIAIFALMPRAQMSIFAIVYCGMLPYTAIAYDERSKWDDLAATMPYTPGDIVLSKYVLGWIAMAFAAVLSLAAHLVLGGLLPDYYGAAALSTILPSFCFGLLIIAVTLPFMFRFGVERGRIFFIFLIVILSVVGSGLLAGLFDGGSGQMPALLRTLVNPILSLAGVVGTFVSIPLSIKLYQRRTV